MSTGLRFSTEPDVSGVLFALQRLESNRQLLLHISVCNSYAIFMRQCRNTIHMSSATSWQDGKEGKEKKNTVFNSGVLVYKKGNCFLDGLNASK